MRVGGCVILKMTAAEAVETSVTNNLSQDYSNLDHLLSLTCKRNLVKNTNAQHKVLKKPIITETLIKTEINFTDVSSLVLPHSEDVARLATKRQEN